MEQKRVLTSLGLCGTCINKPHYDPVKDGPCDCTVEMPVCVHCGRGPLNDDEVECKECLVITVKLWPDPKRFRMEIETNCPDSEDPLTERTWVTNHDEVVSAFEYVVQGEWTHLDEPHLKKET